MIMAQQLNSVYVNARDGSSEPHNSQQSLSNSLDFEDLHVTLSSYTRVMYEHTMQQLATATTPNRRRSGQNGASSSLTKERSIESVGSSNS